MTIFFYKVCEPYGCFSNFSLHPIELGGQVWPTSEHYYQAQKFVETPYQHLCQQIQTAPTPEQAAQIGRHPKHIVRPGWDGLKIAVMYGAVLTKFTTYSDLAQLLLETGQDLIVEDSPRDAYWGCGADGRGQNQLGKILMRVRAQLR